MKPLLFAAAFALIATAAWADTMKDASFKVTPGQYHWVQNTSVAGIPINEDNTECLTGEQSNMSLSGLAKKLQKTCTVDNVVQTANGYTFKLICAGKYPGTADAKLVKSDKAMGITAEGSAKLLGIPAGFSVKADATFVGACTPEQLEKAAEKAAAGKG
ncbi:MAG: DUF3617 family protein [Alphaproteobacteria bacterium]